MFIRSIALVLPLGVALGCDSPGRTGASDAIDAIDAIDASTADVVADAATDTSPDSPLPESSPIPPECLLGEVPCVDQGDCVAVPGTRCNTAMAEPMCQTIRCGAEGASCVDEAQCPTGMQCQADRCGTCASVPEGGACVNGQIVCLDGLRLCGSRCVDTRSDPAHCGACNTPVPEQGFCASGEPDCGSSSQMCGGECVEGNDYEHCGGCDLSCDAVLGEACAGLECDWGSCERTMCQVTVSLDRETVCAALCSVMGGSCVEGYEYRANAGRYPVGCDQPADYECDCAFSPRRAP